MTKDIRGKEGWRILLDIEESRVQLFHIRRDQSIDAFGQTRDHFELEFETVVTFERATVCPTAGVLRIRKLSMGEEMSEEMKAKLRGRLLGDVIIS